MTPGRIGLGLLVVGILLNQYGFLHDLVWNKHDGAIYMGMQSYLAIGAGLAAVVGGGVLMWRSGN